MQVHERVGPLIQTLRIETEKPIQIGLERIGFVPVEEDKEMARQLRVDTLRTTWALKGLTHLLEFEEDASSNHPEIDDTRIKNLGHLLSTDDWQHTNNVRLRGIIRRILSVSSRRELLTDTLSTALADNSPPEEKQEARHRLTMMLDIIDGKIIKPQVGKRAVIFTQTAYLLGSVKKDIPYGFTQWLDFAFQLGGGALPYLGAAVVYSELMGTGQFKEIKICDFRDQEAINNVIANKEKYDLSLVSGATTYDQFLIDNLNRQLSSAGLTVLNGGIAPTIDEDPERYLNNGGSIFIGEVEGAADQLVQFLNQDSTPRIFIRNNNSVVSRKLRRKGILFTALDCLEERVDMEDVYTVEGEREGYLVRRLEALELMRPFANFAGVAYEPPPSFRFHETVTSYGCPNACNYCATVEPQGVEMRTRTIDSIYQEWQAIESPNIAIVDQNFTANGRTYVQDLLATADQMGKRLSFQGELLFFAPTHPDEDPEQHFFDGSNDDRHRKQLLRDASLYIEVGIEQPAKVRGSQPGRKDPNRFAEALERLNQLGLIVFETAIIGMPKVLWADGDYDVDERIIPYESKTHEEWEEMLDIWIKWLEEKVPSPGAIPFAFTVIPGTPAYRILEGLRMLKYPRTEIVRRKEQPYNLSPSLDPNVIIGIDSRKAVEDLRRRLYRLPSIIKRLRAANYPPKRLIFMFLFNLIMDKAFRDTME